MPTHHVVVHQNIEGIAVDLVAHLWRFAAGGMAQDRLKQVDAGLEVAELADAALSDDRVRVVLDGEGVVARPPT